MGTSGRDDQANGCCPLRQDQPGGIRLGEDSEGHPGGALPPSPLVHGAFVLEEQLLSVPAGIQPPGQRGDKVPAKGHQGADMRGQGTILDTEKLSLPLLYACDSHCRNSCQAGAVAALSGVEAMTKIIWV